MTVPCTVCGAESPRPKLRKQGVEILECAVCGLAFWTPPPDHRAEAVYDRAYALRPTEPGAPWRIVAAYDGLPSGWATPLMLYCARFAADGTPDAARKGYEIVRTTFAGSETTPVDEGRWNAALHAGFRTDTAWREMPVCVRTRLAAESVCCSSRSRSGPVAPLRLAAR